MPQERSERPTEIASRTIGLETISIFMKMKSRKVRKDASLPVPPKERLSTEQIQFFSIFKRRLMKNRITKKNRNRRSPGTLIGIKMPSRW
jgi:hypothetical protein